MDDSDSGPQYPIRAAVQRTGLSPHTLRAWERRYGFPKPARLASGRRLYSDADIRRLRLLRQLTERGHSIGNIAGLDPSALVALAQQAEALAAGDAAGAAGATGEGEAHRYLNDALAVVGGMETRQLNAILNRAAVSLSARELIDGVIHPLLDRVGRMWAAGEICPAHEHFVSVQVGRVLGWLAETIPVPSGAPEAVAATPAGERHEFGALLAGIAAAKEGWQVTYLGADLPAHDIAVALRTRAAGVLLLSVAVEAERPALLRELSGIRDAVGDEVTIFVGGRGAAMHRVGIERSGGRWLPDLAALRAALRALPLSR